MKNINSITTVLGVLLVLTIIPVAFIVKENLGVLIPALAVVGFAAIWFKNLDMQALVKRYLDTFKK